MLTIKKLGSDPEVVLLDNTTKKPVSAIGLNYFTPDIQIYADNLLAEVNHSAFVPSEFASGIKQTLTTVDNVLGKFKQGCHYRIGQCSALYTPEQTELHEAQEVGCKPFLSAYNLGGQSTPKPYTDNYRYAGGHIHIAYDHKDIPPHLLVQLLDKELLSQDPNHNKTPRSDFYGAKGSFRLKSYGLEYRAVSNWWLANPQIVPDVLSDITDFVNRKYYGIKKRT